MSQLGLKYYGDPILRKETDSVKEFDHSLELFAQEMIETMRTNDGVGLAGPQVGDLRSLIVIDVSSEEDEEPVEPLILVNPDIKELSGSCVMEEGCLSIPDVRVEIERPEEIRIKFQDVKGVKKDLKCDGILARVIQHEVDHLRGRLMIDYLSPVKRDLLKSKLQKISRGDISVGV
ncbi:MAG: peptide deformylase [Candidatus Marinimicrobia bacterium]|nr:peptide deformylase [Candidatus Neomarinimicrobiota bacterium]